MQPQGTFLYSHRAGSYMCSPTEFTSILNGFPRRKESPSVHCLCPLSLPLERSRRWMVLSPSLTVVSSAFICITRLHLHPSWCPRMQGDRCARVDPCQGVPLLEAMDRAGSREQGSGNSHRSPLPCESQL